ncbi:MAG: CHAT domain-containing protein [Chloroflexota bacterium]
MSDNQRVSYSLLRRSLDGRMSAEDAAQLTLGIPESELGLIADCLYQLAIRRRGSQTPSQSLHVASFLIAIGAFQNNPNIGAIGYMLTGDYFNLIEHRYEQAYNHLRQAGTLFRQGSNVFGWARTRIGMLLCAVELGQEKAQQALVDAIEAEQIFKSSDDPSAPSKMLTLYQNRAIVYARVGAVDEAIRDNLYIKRELWRVPEPWRTHQNANIEQNLGLIYVDRGEARRAAYHFMRAYVLHRRSKNFHGQIKSMQGIAETEIIRGMYRSALSRLNDINQLLDQESVDETAYLRITVGIAEAECYLSLNYFDRVQRILKPLLDFQNGEESTGSQWAFIWFLLAESAAGLGNYAKAETYFQEALRCSTEQTPVWVIIHLRRGQVALRRKDYSLALEEAQIVLQLARERRQQIEEASAMLLAAQVKCAMQQDYAAAQDYANAVLKSAEACSAFALLYGAYVVLGHVARVTEDTPTCIQFYLQAAQVVDETQRDLTILLRSGFLADKGEALRALIQLHLDQSQVERALEILERSKSQVFSAYLADRDSLDWASDDLKLASEIDDAREQLQSLLSLENTRQNDAHTAKRIKQIQAQLKALSPKMNRLQNHRLPDISLAEIQAALQDDTLLIEYYFDGRIFHAFVVDKLNPPQHYELAESGVISEQMSVLESAVEEALDRLNYFHLTNPNMRDLDILSDEVFCDPGLNRIFNRAAQDLYHSLLAPLQQHLDSHNRLVIVPYSRLHSLPFHLLYQTDRGQYLIEAKEVVILPTAALLGHKAVKSDLEGGAVVIYDELNSHLLYSLRDAEHVHSLLGGSLHNAQRISLAEVFGQCQYQILHIIAHGEFNGARPEESFIQLYDQRITYAALQHYDLNYELVTLASCNAGQLHMYEQQLAMGDDQIGMGRGFLHAGAGALMLSHWVIGDGLTQTFFKGIYRRLQRGYSKAKALQQTQAALHRCIPDLHPVYWGGFQLIGDPNPLGQSSGRY